MAENKNTVNNEKEELASQIRKMLSIIVDSNVYQPVEYSQDGSISLYINNSSKAANGLRGSGLNYGPSSSKDYPDHIEVIIPANVTGIQKTFKAMENAIIKRATLDIEEGVSALPEDRQAEFKKRVLTAIAQEIGVDSPNTGKAVSSRG